VHWANFLATGFSFFLLSLASSDFFLSASSFFSSFVAAAVPVLLPSSFLASDTGLSLEADVGELLASALEPTEARLELLAPDDGAELITAAAVLPGADTVAIDSAPKVPALPPSV
jgi:hypothetical protein